MKAKSIIKKVALALAGVAALGLLAWGVKAIVDYTKNELKTISPTFEVGNLGADGKFVDDESTLYTKEAFQCDGLQIKLDFDNQISYQIFYYDDLDNFIESTEVLSDAYSGGEHDSYARIVIIPTNDDDDKISLKERITYPGQITVKVSKSQLNAQYVNVFNNRLRIVNEISSLRFVHGTVEYKNGQYSFISDDNESVTSKDTLAVTGGYKLTLNSSVVSIPDGCKSSFTIFEFCNNKGTFELVKHAVMSSDLVVLDKYTTHIVIVGSFVNISTSEVVHLTQKNLYELNSAFSIGKNK